MKAFAVKEKRATPAARSRQGPVTRPWTPALQAQRAEIRNILHGPRVQPKLKVGAPDDKYEQEADRVADAVMRMPAPGAPEKTPVLGREEDTAIRRLCPECEEGVRRQPVEEEELEEEAVQAKASPGGVPEMTHDLDSRIQAMRGGGQPLPESTRAFFEPRFGHDFSQVRVHTGARAAEAARAVNARAFTVGRDIAFGAGEYTSTTETGSRLLAHELTHVVQHERGCRARPVLRRFVGKSNIGEVSGNAVAARYIYTCNCGWVDTDHVGAYAGHYATIIAEFNKKKKGSVTLQATIPGFIKTDRAPVTYQFDTTAMTQPRIDDLAMRILYDMARREEYLQGQPWSGAGRWTSAAFEDISSDMVGALVGQELARNPRLTQNDAIIAVLTKCAPVSKGAAERVYEHNSKTMSSGISWSAVPPSMTNDPCAKMKPAPYPDFDFTNKKKFPVGDPGSAQPPAPFR